jgi:polar amino acid transport system ATP-binding protein
VSGAPVITIEGVTKAFGDREVLKGIDLEIAEHEAVAVIGASGSGKSTLLRCVDLLIEIDDGDVYLDGEVVTDPSADPVAVRRKLGFVFQAYNLFPHLNVIDNVTLGISRAHGLDKEEGVTMLIATHEMGFAREVADRVGFLHEGRLAEVGPPEQVLERPRDPNTQKFLRRLLEAGRA